MKYAFFFDTTVLITFKPKNIFSNIPSTKLVVLKKNNTGVFTIDYLKEKGILT